MTLVFPDVYSILLLGSIQGSVLGGIILGRKSGNKLIKAVTAALLFSFSISIGIHCISHILYLPFLSENHEILIIISMANLGPIYYSYVKCLTDPGFKLKMLIRISCPFLFELILLVPVYILTIGSLERNTIREVASGLNFLISAVFIILSLRGIIRYIERVRNNFSNLDKINLKWLVFLTVCLVAFLFVNLFLFFVRNEAQGNIIWLASSVIIFLIGYFSMIQPEIFHEFHTGEGFDKCGRKYRKSVLTRDMAEKYLEKLNTVMEEKKLYLDSSLTLPILSEETGIPVHSLSQIINESIGQNFYDFINFQRIQDAMKRLADPSGDSSIASIAFDVGFNTLSSFNSSFKKYTGITPSQYRKKEGSFPDSLEPCISCRKIRQNL